MRSLATAVLLTGALTLLLAACGSAADPAVRAVEGYLTSLVAKDGDRLAALSCADWEQNALLELDSLQAVEVRLEDMACTNVGADGETTLVNCEGKILATYNDEDQELALSVRTYQVVQQGGEYLVCGYR